MPLTTANWNFRIQSELTQLSHCPKRGSHSCQTQPNSLRCDTWTILLHLNNVGRWTFYLAFPQKSVVIVANATICCNEKNVKMNVNLLSIGHGEYYYLATRNSFTISNRNRSGEISLTLLCTHRRRCCQFKTIDYFYLFSTFSLPLNRLQLAISQPKSRQIPQRMLCETCISANCVWIFV